MTGGGGDEWETVAEAEMDLSSVSGYKKSRHDGHVSHFGLHIFQIFRNKIQFGLRVWNLGDASALSFSQTKFNQKFGNTENKLLTRSLWILLYSLVAKVIVFDGVGFGSSLVIIVLGERKSVSGKMSCLGTTGTKDEGDD